MWIPILITNSPVILIIAPIRLYLSKARLILSENRDMRALIPIAMIRANET